MGGTTSGRHSSYPTWVVPRPPFVPDLADPAVHRSDSTDPETTAEEQPVSAPIDRDPAAPDPDPTGMRELLAALPDPGPMPPEVAHRITAALQHEQRHRVSHPPQEGMPSPAPERTRRRRLTPAATVGSLDSRRHSRVPQMLAVAASVAAVALAGVVVLDQVAGDGSLGDMAAVYWNGDNGSSSDAAGGGSAEAGAERGGGDESSEDSLAGAESRQNSGDDTGQEKAAPDAAAKDEAPPGEQLAVPLVDDLRVIAVTDPLTSETFATGVRTALERADAPGQVADAQPQLSSRAGQACVTATGENLADQQWTVSAITLDGDDAVLVVATDRTDRAWALAAQCAVGEPSAPVLLGPVEVP